MIDLILCEYAPSRSRDAIVDETVASGPRTLLNSGLLPALARSGAPVADIALIPARPDEHARNRQEMLARVTVELAARVEISLARGHIPLTLGDCTAAIGVVAGIKRRYGAAGVVWADAHGDLNTEESSLSGYLGGMPLATITGKSLPWLASAAGLSSPCRQEEIALVAARDLDPYEEDYLRSSRIVRVSARELNDAATAPVAVERVTAAVCPAGLTYFHLDIDALDPSLMPSVTFPSPGGLSLEALDRLVESIGRTGLVRAVTVASFNPSGPGAASDAGTLASLIARIASKIERKS